MIENIVAKGLSTKQIAQLKELLESQKQGIEDHLAEELIKDQDIRSSEEADRATQEEIELITLKSKSRDSLMLKKIDEALIRIGKDQYGLCGDCDAVINIERLKARPTANLCIECKKIQERQENQVF